MAFVIVNDDNLDDFLEGFSQDKSPIASTQTDEDRSAIDKYIKPTTANALPDSSSTITCDKCNSIADNQGNCQCIPKDQAQEEEEEGSSQPDESIDGEEVYAGKYFIKNSSNNGYRYFSLEATSSTGRVNKIKGTFKSREEIKDVISKAEKANVKSALINCTTKGTKLQ